MQATDGACVTSVCRVPGREPWKVETAAIKGCVCLLSLYGVLHGLITPREPVIYC